MKRKLLALATLGTVVCSGPAFAYQYEVGGNLGKREVDRKNAEDDDDTTFSLNGTIYMENVTDQNGPRKEYAFLAKSSYASFDFDDYGDSDEMTASGRYMFDPVKNYFIDAALEAADTDSLNVEGGMYLTDMSTIKGGVKRTSKGDEDDFLITGSYKQLYSLGVNGTLVGEASLELGDGREIELSGSYFINYDIGIGLSYTDIDGDEDKGETDGKVTAVFASFFVQPNLEFYGRYATGDFDSADVDLLEFGVNVRL